MLDATNKPEQAARVKELTALLGTVELSLVIFGPMAQVG